MWPSKHDPIEPARRRSVRFIALALCLFGLALVATFGAAKDRLPAPSCRYDGWSDPVALTPENAILRSPQIALAAEHAAVTGDNVVELGNAPLDPIVFRAYTTSGINLGTPVGLARTPAYPAAAADHRGLFVSWAEATEPMSTAKEWLDAPTSSVWFATHSPPGGWSAPRQIYTGSRRVDMKRSGNVLIDQSSRVHTLFIDDRLVPSVLIHAIVDTALAVDSLRIGMGTFLRAAMTSADEIVAAYVGFDGETRTSGIVYVSVWQEDSGWRTPRMLPGSESGDAADVNTLWSGHRALVMWRTRVGIAHAWSDDGGRTWQVGEQLRSGSIDRVRAAADPCGNVHVVYEDWVDEGRPSIGYSILDRSGSWMSQPRPLPNTDAIEPAIASDSERILLVASIADRERSKFTPVALNSRLRAGTLNERRLQ
jgi:hypothetical protein